MGNVHSISDIGIMVRNTRRANKLTQEQLAAACGSGVRFLRELEHGKESCHMGKALHVINMLGLEVYILKRGELPR